MQAKISRIDLNFLAFLILIEYPNDTLIITLLTVHVTTTKHQLKIETIKKSVRTAECQVSAHVSFIN